MNPDRIRPLQDLAATAPDAAAARLARANDALQAAEQKLCELQTYAAEYGAAIAAGRPGARLLQNRRVFHSRLLDAIAAQRREVDVGEVVVVDEVDITSDGGEAGDADGLDAA